MLSPIVGTSGSDVRALAVGHRERAQRTSLDVLQRIRHGVDPGLHPAGEHVGDQRHAAAIRHVHDVGAGRELEQFDRQMADGAGAERAHVDLAGIGLGVGDQFRHRLRRECRRCDQHERQRDEAADRRDVAQEVERQLLVEGGVDRVGGGGQQDGVAVGRRADHRLRRDVVGGAGLVLDHHRLAEALRQEVGHDPRQDVGGAAGRIRHDPADRPGREVAAAAAPFAQKAKACEQYGNEAANTSHHDLPARIAAREACAAILLFELTRAYRGTTRATNAPAVLGVRERRGRRRQWENSPFAIIRWCGW